MYELSGLAPIEQAPIPGEVATVGTAPALLFTGFDDDTQAAHTVRRIRVCNTHPTASLAVLVVLHGVNIAAKTIADGWLVQAGDPPLELPVRGTCDVAVIGSTAGTTLSAAASDVVVP